MPYDQDARSLAHYFQLSCRHWGKKVSHRVPDGRDRRDVTFEELYELAFGYAGAVWDLGVRRGEVVCLYSENCFEWALLDWGCQTLGIILVPIYPTVTGEQAQYIANDSQCKIFVAGSAEHAERVKGLLSVPVLQLLGPDSMTERSKNHQLSREQWESEIAAATLDDVATIIYTSGTTGDPKGAVLTHRAMAATSRSVRYSLPIDENDTFLSWLPLAHVYERFAGHVLPTLVGATVAYAGSLATLAGDMEKCRPTIMLAVPRFLESMRERILDSTKKMPPLRKRLFDLTLSQGTRRARGQAAPLWPVLDKLVASKVRERTGGRLKFFVSGGAAMPMHVYEFFGAFGLLVLQGYGLTETCAGTSLNPPDDNRPDTVGVVVDGIEAKIAPDGEILLRGPSIMREYFNKPKETAEAIDAEGWFHTGDIGEFVGKHLKITDRKKDLLVLENGKNVAPQPIENKLRACDSIAEAVLLGDGKPYVGALILPNLMYVENLVHEAGLKITEPEAMLSLEPVRAAIKADIDRVNKSLADFEKVKRFEVLAVTFSVETGELTPSLKVKRKVVREKYAEAIRRLFKEG